MSPPTLTGDQQAELYLLARHFQMTAHEAWCVYPSWEIDLRIQGLLNETADGR